jgi:hypothetical protein
MRSSFCPSDCNDFLEDWTVKQNPQDLIMLQRKISITKELNKWFATPVIHGYTSYIAVRHKMTDKEIS